jgi:TonB family protein
MAMDTTRDVFRESYYGEGEPERRHWLGALLTSSVLYVGFAVLIAAVGLGTRQIVTEREVEVKFVEQVAKVEPPPPVAKPVEVKPAPPKVSSKPPAAAAVVPKGMKVRKLDAPPPPKTLAAPTDMPLGPAAEADASLDRGVGVYGEYVEGDVAGLEGGIEGGVAGGVYGALPSGATAPRPSRGNPQPKYPREARKAGKVGLVRFKVVITADGHVDGIEVVDGEPPFADAALQAVRKWRYQPAQYQGETIAVRRVIEVHFKLRA